MRTSQFDRLVVEPRDDVNVNVRMGRIFSKECEIRSTTSENGSHGARHALDERAEFKRLVVGQISEGGNVTTKGEDEPSLERSAEGVDNVPVLGSEHVVSRGSAASVTNFEKLTCPAIRHQAES